MGFNRSEASELLVACHRRCCICHRYCGIKIELHHIEPRGDGGVDAIDNAIPVCFECHAEIQLYNDSHPRGASSVLTSCACTGNSGSVSVRSRQVLS